MTGMTARIGDARTLALLGLAFAIALTALIVISLQAGAAQAQSTDPLVQRGEYLVTAGPCAECHTVRVEGNPFQLDASMFLAGERRFDLPFGTVFSANITSDVETGIGSWTVGELMRALDEGIDKDGNPLVLMPWQEFRGMSTEDKFAIAVYLKSTAPISNEVPAPDLSVPAAAIHAGAAEEAFSIGGGIAPDGSDAFARGEYLVWSALGCTGCHGTDLKGNFPPFFAPDITAETGQLAGWTNTEIATVLTTGTRPNASTLAPVMPWGPLAYGNLTNADLDAVATYLKNATSAEITARTAVPAPEGGDITLNPYLLAGAGIMLLLLGFGVTRTRLRRQGVR